MDPLLRKLNFRGGPAPVAAPPPEAAPPPAALERETAVDRTPAGDRRYAFALAFVQHEDEVREPAPAVAPIAEQDGVLWFAYPQRSSRRYRAIISRDIGRAALGRLGLEPVRQVGIDDDRSVLRFRHVRHIGALRRAPERRLTGPGQA